MKKNQQVLNKVNYDSYEHYNIVANLCKSNWRGKTLEIKNKIFQADQTSFFMPCFYPKIEDVPGK